MEIRAIEIENYGIFQAQQFELQPGWQIIYGKNEAGKSTLKEFILFVLFGTRAVAKTRNLSSGDGGSLLVEADQSLYLIKRKVQKQNNKVRVINQKTGKIYDEKWLKENLLNNLDYKDYRNIFEIGYDTQKKDLNITEWQKLALSYALLGNKQYQKLKSKYQKQQKRLYDVKSGRGLIVDLQQQYAEIKKELLILNNQQRINEPNEQILEELTNQKKTIAAQIENYSIYQEYQKITTDVNNYQLIMSLVAELDNDVLNDNQRLIQQYLKAKALGNEKQTIEQKLKHKKYLLLVFLVGVILGFGVNKLLCILLFIITMYLAYDYFQNKQIEKLLKQKIAKVLKTSEKHSSLAYKELEEQYQYLLTKEQQPQEINNYVAKKLEELQVPIDDKSVLDTYIKKLQLDYKREQAWQEVKYLYPKKVSLDELQAEYTQISGKLAQVKSSIYQEQQQIGSFKQQHQYSIPYLEQQQVNVKAQLQEVMMNYLRLQLKINWLDDLKDSKQLEVLPSLLSIASKYFNKLTLGKYVKIKMLADDFIVETRTGVTKNSYILSTGTKSQLLLSIRLAFIDYYHLTLPLIMDESWQLYDEERKIALANILAERHKQVIMMTSTKYQLGQEIIILGGEGNEVKRLQN